MNAYKYRAWSSENSSNTLEYLWVPGELVVVVAQGIFEDLLPGKEEKTI
jgi:hypothetical protein